MSMSAADVKKKFLQLVAEFGLTTMNTNIVRYEQFHRLPSNGLSSVAVDNGDIVEVGVTMRGDGNVAFEEAANVNMSLSVDEVQNPNHHKHFKIKVYQPSYTFGCNLN